MAVISLVLESDLGPAKAGTIISCESERGDKLVEAGLCRLATEEEVNGAGDAEEGAEGDVADMGDEDGVKSQHDIVVKATHEAVEKLTKGVVRPLFGHSRHVAGSDELRTGGFKNIGDAVQCFIAKSRGDATAAKRFGKWQAKAMSISGSSGHAGGDLVPQEWSESLFKLSFQSVVNLHGMCSQYPMQHQVLNLPTWVQSSAAAGVVANVIGEGAAITETAGVTATVQLSLVKGAILVNVTDELLRFNGYALESVINDVAPERLRFLINDGVVNGTNSQLNLVNNAAALTQIAEVAGHISYADVMGMYSKLINKDGACWLINPSSIPELYSLGFPNRAASTQFPAFTPGTFGNEQLLGPAPEGKLMGLPVYMVENVPELGTRGALILWQPTSCAAGSSGPYGDRTSALYFNLATDSFRFLLYYDTVNRLTTPYTRVGGSKASNIVVLSAGSTSSS